MSIKGTEQIGWDQTADSSQIASYQYSMYVDDVPTPLGDATCQNTANATVFNCLASLPPLSAGSHRLELSTQASGLESQRSAALYVNVAPAAAGRPVPLLLAGSKATTRASVTTANTAANGVRFMIETLAAGLDAPSALVVTPDGRAFLAQPSGTIAVWEGGHLLGSPALRLTDAAQATDGGLIGMAVHPDFKTNGRVFVAYAAFDGRGTLINRVIRFRDVNNTWREPVVILEDRAAVVPPRPPRIRFGPDGALYVAFSVGDASRSVSSASYEGKILRVNEDGTTPRENPGFSPVISSGHAAVGGLDWQPTTGSPWVAERDWQSRDVMTVLQVKPDQRAAATFGSFLAQSLQSPLDASGLAFYSHGRISGWENDLFIGGLSSAHLRRVHFSPTDLNRVESTERLLDGLYGRISDVVAGPDGALYLVTNNRNIAPGTDRLLRLVPAAGP